MKTSKFLVFKIDRQRFAIRTKMVQNIIEQPKIVEIAECENIKNFYKSAINFRGIVIPIINLFKIIGIKIEESTNKKLVMIIELTMGNKCELVGISIDEIIEIEEFDDFFAFPYIPLMTNIFGDIREGIIIRNNEPVIILNSSKINTSNDFEKKNKPIAIFTN